LSLVAFWCSMIACLVFCGHKISQPPIVVKFNVASISQYGGEYGI